MLQPQPSKGCGVFLTQRGFRKTASTAAAQHVHKLPASFSSVRLQEEQQLAGSAWEEEEEDSDDEDADHDTKAIYGPASEEDAIGGRQLKQKRRGSMESGAAVLSALLLS